MVYKRAGRPSPELSAQRPSDIEGILILIEIAILIEIPIPIAVKLCKRNVNAWHPVQKGVNFGG